MAGCDTSTKRLENTHRPSLSALRAPFGVWGQTQRRRNFLLGVWGGADVKIPTYIVSRAVEGAHTPLLVCPECGPARKLTRFCTLTGPQTNSTWTQTIILAAIDIYVS